MTFSARENSLANAQPIRLYQFTRGVVQWCYASCDRDVSHLSHIYAALAGGISDDGISQGGEASTQNVKITAPASLPVAQLFRGIPPSDVIDVAIFDRHYGETEYRASWIGEIQQVTFPAVDRCQIICSPESVSMQGQGLRLRWERPCPHCVYERGCTVDRELFRVNGTIIATDGATIDASAFSGYPVGYFNAGYIEWPLGDGNYERRAIEAHSGTELTIFGGTSGLPLGQALAAFPGCDQTPTMCQTRFNNYLNYGGFPSMPGRSPFDGNPVF